MDYAEARAAFFQSAPDAAVETAGTPGRRLRAAIEPIATIQYWSEPASTAYEAVGLDFLTGYVWSRASALGEPTGAVAASAFGVFEPGLIASLYDTARAACPHAEVIGARQRGALEALRGTLGDADVTATTAALRRGVDAGDPTARAISAGLAGQEWPEEPLLELWHACETLREYRGDSHLAACASAGLTGLQANLLTELFIGWEPFTYAGTRGWSPEAMTEATSALEARGLVSGGALTAAGAVLRQNLEDATELQLAPVLAAIGDDLDAVIAAAEGWSQQILDAGWFPPDPRKRASG